jgi:hypothetical protein
MTHEYIEAPEEPRGDGPSLFLAGGISNCPDWQAQIVPLLAGLPEGWILVNPRRANFPSDPAGAEEQIRWEHRHLARAAAISFWFPEETLCPITLFELGAWSRSDKPLLVGTHPGYKRRLDVLVQLKLARPDVTVVSSVAELAAAVVAQVRRR